jgi:hypothetical protein
VQLEDFALERYFAQWEFTAKYLLCSSDHDGNHFRIGFGRRDFAEGLERFERFARRVIRED